MGATYSPHEYSVSWMLILEFASNEEQQFWNTPYFKSLVGRIVEQHQRPWVDRTGQCQLSFSEPILGCAPRLGAGPRTMVSFEHRNLTLSLKHLWAYEVWAQDLASQIATAIANTLGSVGLNNSVIADVRMTYSTPLRSTESDYRLASKEGDIVRLPCGTRAVITNVEIVMCGHVKQITLRPICGIWRHLWLKVRNRLTLEEARINTLTKIGEVFTI